MDGWDLNRPLNGKEPNPPPFWMAAIGTSMQAIVFGLFMFVLTGTISYVFGRGLTADLRFLFPSIFKAEDDGIKPPPPLMDISQSDIADATDVICVVALTPKASELCYTILEKSRTDKLQYFTGHRAATTAAEAYDLIAIRDEGKQWTGVSLSEPTPPFDSNLSKTYLESWLLKLMVKGTLPWKNSDSEKLPVVVEKKQNHK